MHCPFWSTKEYWFTPPGTACRFGAVFGGSTDHCKSLGTSDTYDQGHRKLETRKQKSVRRKRHELRFWAWFQQNETEKKKKERENWEWLPIWISGILPWNQMSSTVLSQNWHSCCQRIWVHCYADIASENIHILLAETLDQGEKSPMNRLLTPWESDVKLQPCKRSLWKGRGWKRIKNSRIQISCDPAHYSDRSCHKRREGMIAYVDILAPAL